MSQLHKSQIADRFGELLKEATSRTEDVYIPGLGGGAFNLVVKYMFCLQKDTLWTLIEECINAQDKGTIFEKKLKEQVSGNVDRNFYVPGIGNRSFEQVLKHMHSLDKERLWEILRKSCLGTS